MRQYGFVKRVENFWKGLRDKRDQISPVPPQQYGDRFLNFVTGITMTKEEADRRRRRQTGESAFSEVAPLGVAVSQRTSLQTPGEYGQSSLEVPGRSSADREKQAMRSPPGSPMAVEHTMEKAQMQVDRETSDKGRRRSEEEKPNRTLLTAEDGKTSTLLPVVSEEGGEGSRGGSVSASARGSEGGAGATSRSRSRDEEAMERRAEEQVEREEREAKERKQRSQREEVDRELKRQGSEGIRIVESNDHETDWRGYEKVSVQMPGPGHGADYDPDWESRAPQVDGAEEQDSGVGMGFGKKKSQPQYAPAQQAQTRSKPPRINSDIIPPFSPFETSDDMRLGFGDPEKNGHRESLR
jgi:hypothetical protein